VDQAVHKRYPLKLWLAYGAFGMALPAQYVLYWLISAARSSWLIEARTMSVLHEAVFYGAPVLVGSATLMLWIAAEDAPTLGERSVARLTCTLGLVSLLPQVVLGLLMLSGFKDS